MTMSRIFPILFGFLAAASTLGAAEPTVSVSASTLAGPRPLEEQTRTAAIRDYLESWQAMTHAFEQNQAGLLDADFVGAARDTLGAAIRAQASLGIQTDYQDRSHDIQILFYSPEGLSIELADTVAYDVQVSDHGKPVATIPARARYIVVLSPSEVRWQVRLLQAASQ
jgi:hypothetical protein